MLARLDRNKYTILLCLILALALALRIRFIGHTLSWDEASNMLNVRVAVTGQTAYFFNNFYLHPPLYLALGILYGYVLGPSTVFLELLSLGAGILSIVALFFLVRRQLGDSVAIGAAFFLAVIPAAMVFDTWVKQDAFVVLFSLLCFYYFLEDKYYMSGLFLALAFLSKETAIFYAIGLTVYVLANGSREKLVGWAKMAAFPVVLCSWWYLGFGRVGLIGSFFKGDVPYATERLHGGPWYKQFTRLPFHANWLILALALLGVAFWLYNAFAKNRGDAKERLFGTELFIFVVLVASVLFVTAISSGKTPWMNYTLMTGIAVLASYGMVETARVFRRRSVPAATLLLAGCIVLVVLWGVSTDYDRFMNKTDPMYPWSVRDKDTAEYLNGVMSPNDRIFIRTENLNTNFYQYCTAWDPNVELGGIYPIVEGKTLDERIPEEDRIVLFVQERTTAGHFLEMASAYGAGYALFQKGNDIGVFEELESLASGLPHTVQIEDNLVFNLHEVERKVRGAR